MKRFATACLVAALLPSFASVQDPHRPQYHFLPPANWMNDAMGIYWKGEYHVFYLYNPGGPVWRQDKHWAHAVSQDLVHWKHLPPALWPIPGGPEKLCCQTGSLVVDNGVPTALYTCAPGVCIATSDDDLRTWKRYAGNPVIPSSPEGMQVTGFRDPYAWKEGDHWYLLMASGTEEVGGTVLLYRSKDLRHWEYLHALLVGEGKSDVVWEVPGLFRLGGKSVLLYSPTKESRFTRYFVGDYANHQFRPEGRGKLDSGGYFYATTTFEDAGKRRIAIGWLREGRAREASIRAGWSGVLSLPRVLTMQPDGRLRVEPAPGVEILRGGRRHFEHLQVTPKSAHLLGSVRGEALEIMAEFDPGGAREFGVKVRCAPGGREETLVGYDVANQEFFADATRSSTSPEADNRRSGDRLELGKNGGLKFWIFVDHSVVEAFADGAAIATRVYPSLPDSLGIDLFAAGGNAKLISLDVWEMKSIALP